MNWSLLSSRYPEIKTFVLLVAIVGFLAFLAIHFGNLPQQRTNAGFGPDWECTGSGRGDPICVKKTGAGK